MSVLQENRNPAVPNIPLATNAYERRYVDQLNNVFRLYFNQLNALGGTLIQNQNTMQAEIEALQAADAAMQLQIDRDLTLVWLGSGEGLFSG